jgi:hypothetical protein
MYIEDGQVSLFDQDTWSGRTCPEPSVAEAQKGRTSQRSLKNSSKSQSRMPRCVCCRRVTDGQNPAVTMIAMDDGRLLGEYTMRSFGECPREENVSRLSQILEDSAHPKYSLSARACTGILNRAERRGKELPVELKEALIAQSASKETELTEPTQLDATGADGAGGELHPQHHRPAGSVQSAFRNEPVSPGGAKESSSNLSELEPCQPSTISPCLTAGFDGTKGAKARGIGYEVEKAMTTTTSGGWALPDTVGCLEITRIQPI